MSQCTIIYKYDKRSCQLKSKRELNNFQKQWRPAKIAPHRALNEKEVIELLENTTPGSTNKATKYGMKVFQDKNLKPPF